MIFVVFINKTKIMKTAAFNNTRNTDQVARKLVLMEQDLERSEEKVELSERFVLQIFFFCL